MEAELLSTNKVSHVKLDVLFEAIVAFDTANLENLIRNNAPKDRIYAPIIGSLTAHGYVTDGHGALTCTFSRNAETGAVTITYSEPQGLPVHFSWTTTIEIDGTSTSTPLVVRWLAA